MKTEFTAGKILAGSLLLAALAFAACGGSDNNKASGPSGKDKAGMALPVDSPEVRSMKCEFVPDGGMAVIYGKNLTDACAIFPSSKREGLKAVAENGSSDTVLVVKVPAGAGSGFLKIRNAAGTTQSKFVFRDNRNTILDFDIDFPTWGGFDPYYEDENGKYGLIDSVVIDDVVMRLPAPLPEGCSGNYRLVFDHYGSQWTMNPQTFLQYVAKPSQGGRGDVSIAGRYANMDIKDLALKFEVYVPCGHPYKKVHTEIYFGPYDCADYHGRDKSPIYFWEPFAKTGSFCTDSWQTVTVPLTQFTHGIHSNEEVFPTPMDLFKSTNFTFVVYGDDVLTNPNEYVYICVDNFRVVPID